MKKLITSAVAGLCLLALGACASLPAQARRALPTPKPHPTTTTVWVERCLDSGGPGVVRAGLNEVIDCDIVPPQTLTLIVGPNEWAAHSGSTEGWGGDASLAWATSALEDAGCTLTWVNPIQVEGARCDY